MQITVVSNNKGKMCKTYNKDLTKDGSSQLYEGKYKGTSYRTYVGEKYKGGYSDHFPVYITLKTI